MRKVYIPERPDDSVGGALAPERKEVGTIKPYQELPEARLLETRTKSETTLVGAGGIKGLVQRKRPHVRVLLANAQYVLSLEMEKLVTEAQSPSGLDADSVNKLSKYTEVIVKLAKEEREQDKEDDPSALSDEELLNKVKDVLGKK